MTFLSYTVAWKWITSSLAGDCSDAAVESQMVCMHTRQQGGIVVIWKILEWEEDHLQEILAFYLEVTTLHPEDTEFSVRR